MLGNAQDAPASDPNCDRNLAAKSNTIQTESGSDRTRKQRDKSGEICDKSRKDISTNSDPVIGGEKKHLTKISEKKQSYFLCLLKPKIPRPYKL